VCVTARIVDDAKDGAVDIANIDKPADKVSRERRSRFQAMCAWMRPWSGTQARETAGLTRAFTVASPQAGPLLRVTARRDPGRNPKGWHEFSPMALSLTLPIFAILAADRFAP
jgi:hypothetical protein